MAPQWDAGRYAANAAFVPTLGASLLEWLAPRPGERILDLGCGEGQLTMELVTRGAEVVGVDGSPEMVAAACARGLDAQVMDGQDLQFESEFDAVFSNAALHWMRRDPAAVLAGVWRALKPGGRFVAEMGGAGNIRAVEESLEEALVQFGVDPWSMPRRFYPSPGMYREMLEKQGFRVERMDHFPRPTPLSGDFMEWLEIFAQEQAALLPPEQRMDYFRAVRSLAAPRLQQPDGSWVLDYVRLRFAAVRPANT
jgi:trans-aconitate methyltransferase